MEKPKKQIMYRPPTEIKTGEKDEGISRINTTPKLPEKKAEPKKNEQKKYDGKKIAAWIKQAALLNLAALCKEAKIDRANLDKYLTKGVIPEQHIKSLVEVIKNYGYGD